MHGRNNKELNSCLVAGMRPIVAPAAHHTARRRDAEVSAGHVPRRRRPKQAQPILVIMPDGYSLCFAIKESHVGDAAVPSSHTRRTVHTVVIDPPAVEADPLHTDGNSQSQPDTSSAILPTAAHVAEDPVEQTPPGGVGIS